MMKTQREKMIAGEPYDPADPQLVADRQHCHGVFARLNSQSGASVEQRREIICELVEGGEGCVVVPPLYCDYGYNVRLGKNVFFNFNCVLLDCAPITIGDNVLFGPNVQLYTPLHPLAAAARRTGVETARPIVIGDDVWIGGGAIVCPGVTIGARSVIGAGSVVTRDVPPDSLAVGNPARVIRSIDQQEADAARR